MSRISSVYIETAGTNVAGLFKSTSSLEEQSGLPTGVFSGHNVSSEITPQAMAAAMQTNTPDGLDHYFGLPLLKKRRILRGRYAKKTDSEEDYDDTEIDSATKPESVEDEAPYKKESTVQIAKRMKRFHR